MIDFYHLSLSDLQNIGIEFSTKQETDAFIDFIKEEMEVRVGEAVAEGRTEREMTLFEACQTDEETQNWLNTYCPDYKEKIKTVCKQLERELILNREHISGNIGEKHDHSSNEENDDITILLGNHFSAKTDIEKHIISIQNEKHHIGKLYNKGLLSEKERKQKVENCFKSKFTDYLNDRNLQIKIDPDQWVGCQKSFPEQFLLHGYSWLVYSRVSKEHLYKDGDEASEQDKTDIKMLMEAFHVPIDYFQPIPKGIPVPEERASKFNPNYYFIGWKSWKEDGGLFSDNFRFGNTIELIDQYGLKSKIRIDSCYPYNNGDYWPDMDEYSGMGTIEGYTSSRLRIVRVFTRDKNILELGCERKDDDFGFPMWDEYYKYKDKIQRIYEKIIDRNIRDTKKNPREMFRDYYSILDLKND